MSRAPNKKHVEALEKIRGLLTDDVLPPGFGGPNQPATIIGWIRERYIKIGVEAARSAQMRSLAIVAERIEEAIREAEQALEPARAKSDKTEV